MSAPDQDSALFDYGRGLTPGVKVGSTPWVMPLALIGLAVLAGLVFTSLQSARIARQKPVSGSLQPAPNPVFQPTVIPPVTVTTAPPNFPVAMPQAAMSPLPANAPAVAPPTIDAAVRLKAPAVIVDLSGQAAAQQPQIQPVSSGLQGANSDTSRLSAEDRFTARVLSGSAETAGAARIGNLSTTAVQGTVIPAVLETAINSTLPGFVRGVVTRDVRGFDGTLVLIPRGSKLIGQYHAGVAQGQSRAFVVWSRVVTPEGISVDVGSPGTDTLGRGGIEGETDNQFFRRFGGSIMLSVLTAALESATGHGSNSSAIIIGSNTQASNIAQIALQKQIDIAPIIRIPQGEPIRVFLVRDVDFSTISGVNARPLVPTR
jgi:type IV secretory pathway VirB10-like protein